MIESMPVILNDKGVQEDIRLKVENLMKERFYPEKSSLASLSELIERRIRWAAEWGISMGFSMGWKLGENNGIQHERQAQILKRQMEKGGDQ